MTIRIVAKGTVVEVIAAASRWDLDLIEVWSAGNGTYTAEVEADDTMRLVVFDRLGKWFSKGDAAPFPPGTLLWYGESRLEAEQSSVVMHGTMTGRFPDDGKVPSPGDVIQVGDTVEVVKIGPSADPSYLGKIGTITAVRCLHCKGGLDYPFTVEFAKYDRDGFELDELKLIKRG
jgi:hypothetical protein